MQKALPALREKTMGNASVECKDLFDQFSLPKKLKNVFRGNGVTALGRPKREKK